MKLGGKNKHKSKISDWHNWAGAALWWSWEGGEQFEKIRKNEVFVFYERVTRS